MEKRVGAVWHEARASGLRLKICSPRVQPLLEKLAGAVDHVTFAAIPGADHAYTHQRDYVWGVVSRWLEKV